MDIFSDLLTIVAVAVPVIIAITFHEAAHGIVAWRLGDDTAYALGRVTLNPLRHIDAFGTILLPGLLLLLSGGRFVFGWAKPVPVNFNRLGQPRRDMVLVAAAGPVVNILLAVCSALLVHLVLPLPPTLAEALIAGLNISIWVNILLAVFNMLPLPPLDGGRVAVGLLPEPLAFALARLERWGLFILVAVLFIVPLVGDQLGINLNIFEWVILPLVDVVRGAILGATGVA